MAGSVKMQKKCKKGGAKGCMLIGIRQEMMADFNIINNSVVLVNILIQKEKCASMIVY